MKYKIESNIPAPARANAGLTETMRELKIGDSFVCDTTQPAACTIAKRLGIKVATRRTTEGFRVWRVA